MEKRYQVFISSTFADLEEERKGVMEAIIELNCFPAGMEMFPATDKEQFEYIKSVIDKSDYYVIIVAGRYGSIADDGVSYTEKEFDYAKGKGIPILAFLKKNIKTLSAEKTESEPKNRKKLQKFRDKVKKNRIVKHWDTKDELKYQLHSSLSKAFDAYPQIGWIRADAIMEDNSAGKTDDMNKSDMFSLKEEILLDLEKTIVIDIEHPPGKIEKIKVSIEELLSFIGTELVHICSEKSFISIINAFVEFKCSDGKAWKESCAIMPAGLSTIKTKLFALNIIEMVDTDWADYYQYTDFGIEMLKMLGKKI